VLLAVLSVSLYCSASTCLSVCLSVCDSVCVSLSRLLWLRRVGVACLVVVSIRLLIGRLETASQLWRFTMSLVTALLQRMPRITHC